MIKGDSKYEVIVISFDNVYDDKDGVSPAVYVFEKTSIKEVEIIAEQVSEIFCRADDDDERCPGEIFDDLLELHQIEYSYVGYIPTVNHHLNYDQLGDKLLQFDI